jgi:hypothetical protein
MLPTCPNAPNIQGRPTPNRYEKGGLAFNFLSREGTATVYGITEFLPSNPPRKYLESHPNFVNWYREIDPPGSPEEYVGANLDGVLFDTSWNNINPATGAYFNRLAANYDTISTQGSGVMESLKDWVPVATQFRTPYDPDWIEERTKRYFQTVNQNPGEPAPVFYWGNQGLPNVDLGMLMIPTWNVDHWVLNVLTRASRSGGVGTSTFYFNIALIGGDADPGDASTDGQNFGSATVGASTTVRNSWSITLPPNTSVRLGSNAYTPSLLSGNCPVPQGGEIAETGLNPWLYLPADPGDLVREYAEILANENPFYVALGNGSYTPGSDQVAVTNSLTGGTGGGSFTPITINGRTVELQTVLTMQVGNRYQLDVTFRDNTIGLTDYTYETQTFFVDATVTSLARSIYMTAPSGKERIKFSATLTDLGPVPIIPGPTYQSETLYYWGRILGQGGSISSADLDIADAFVVAWKASGLGSKLRYLLPFLGNDVTGALTPLIDRGSWGLMLNAGGSPFVDADFSSSGGLVGGANKILATPFTLGNLAGGANGGWGCYVLVQDTSGAGGGMIGTYWDAGNTVLYGISDNGTDAVFRYGSVSSPTPTTYTWPGTAPTRYDIYGQRLSQTDRRLYIDGAKVATSTASDNNGASSSSLRLMGDTLSGGVRDWAGTAGAAYWTTGGLTDAEVTTLHDLIEDYLITPSGK